MEHKEILRLKCKFSVKNVVVCSICQDEDGRYYLLEDGERHEVPYSELGECINYALQCGNMEFESQADKINIILKSARIDITIIGYGDTKEECIKYIFELIEYMINVHKNKKGRHSKRRIKGRVCKNCAHSKKYHNMQGKTGYWCLKHDKNSAAFSTCHNHKTDSSWTLPSRWVKE